MENKGDDEIEQSIEKEIIGHELSEIHLIDIIGIAFIIAYFAFNLATGNVWIFSNESLFKFNSSIM